MAAPVHDEDPVISGVPDLVGKATLQRVDTTSADGQAHRILVLRLAITTKHADVPTLQALVPGLRLAVDGINLVAHRMEVLEETDGVAAVLFTLMIGQPGVYTQTTLSTPFETARFVNIECTDPRLQGASIFSRSPGVRLVALRGGAMGNPFDAHDPPMLGFLRQVGALAQRSRRYELVVNPEQIHRPLLKYETVYVNGVACVLLEGIDRNSPAGAPLCLFVPPSASHSTTFAPQARGANKDGGGDVDTEDRVNVEFEDVQVAREKCAPLATPALRDAFFMGEAMHLGERGRMLSGRRAWMGVVLVDDDSQTAISTGYNTDVNCVDPVIRCLEQARLFWPERMQPLEQGGTYGSMTLYVTHEPEGADMEGDEVGCDDTPDLVACDAIRGYADVIRRVVVGSLAPLHATLADTPLSRSLNDKGVALELLDPASELSRELRWSLREYLHWRATGRPYTLFLMVQTIDGAMVDRTLIADDTDASEVERLVQQLRITAHALVTDDVNLVRNPGVFEDVVVDEATGLRHVFIDQPSYGAASGDDAAAAATTTATTAEAPAKPRPNRVKILAQPLPMRIVLAGHHTLGMDPGMRKALMPRTEALGSVFLFGTQAFMARDFVAHEALLKAAGINIFGALPTAAAAAATWEPTETLGHRALKFMWPNEPTLSVCVAQASDPMAPRAESVFHAIGKHGVMTALVEGDGSLLTALCEEHLVQELLVCTVPVVAGRARETTPWWRTQAPAQMPWHRLVTMAVGMLGDSGISTQHYKIVDAASMELANGGNPANNPHDSQ